MTTFDDDSRDPDDDFGSAGSPEPIRSHVLAEYDVLFVRHPSADNDASKINEYRSFPYLLREYESTMRIRHYREETIMLHRRYLEAFVKWCAGYQVTKACEVTRDLLQRYVRTLYLRCPDDLLGVSSRIVPISDFFTMLRVHNLVVSNPVFEPEPPETTEALAGGAG